MAVQRSGYRFPGLCLVTSNTGAGLADTFSEPWNGVPSRFGCRPHDEVVIGQCIATAHDAVDVGQMSRRSLESSGATGTGLRTDRNVAVENASADQCPDGLVVVDGFGFNDGDFWRIGLVEQLCCNRDPGAAADDDDLMVVWHSFL